MLPTSVLRTASNYETLAFSSIWPLQVATQSSYLKAWTIITFQFGYKKRVTIPTMWENSWMDILLQLGTNRYQPAGTEPTVSSPESYFMDTRPWPNTVLVDPGTYIYWNATFQKNQSPPASLPGQYNTDLVKDKGLGFIDIAAKSSRPFFVGIAPIGPHAEFTGSGAFTKPVGAKRHQNLFLNTKAPRTKNWNPDKVIHSSITFVHMLNLV